MANCKAAPLPQFFSKRTTRTRPSSRALRTSHEYKTFATGVSEPSSTTKTGNGVVSKTSLTTSLMVRELSKVGITTQIRKIILRPAQFAARLRLLINRRRQNHARELVEECEHVRAVESSIQIVLW